MSCVGDKHSFSPTPCSVAQVRERVAQASRLQGVQSPVRLVAVSKTKPVEDLQAAYDAGQRDFGENYVQVGLPRTMVPGCSDAALIGASGKPSCRQLCGLHQWCPSCIGLITVAECHSP